MPLGAGEGFLGAAAVGAAHFRHGAVKSAHEGALFIDGAAFRGAVRAAVPGAEAFRFGHLADFPGGKRHRAAAFGAAGFAGEGRNLIVQCAVCFCGHIVTFYRFFR